MGVAFQDSKGTSLGNFPRRILGSLGLTRVEVASRKGDMENLMGCKKAKAVL